jgi:DNA processing protein
MTRDPGLASWLRLTLTPGLGGVALRGLLRQYGLPERVLAAADSDLGGQVPSDLLALLRSDALDKPIDATLRWNAQAGNAIVTLADPRYPRRLLETADPPALLYCAGRVELLARPALAVVGSRNASAQGARDAEQFSRALSAAGLTIVSGMALGIDAAAHRGGLAAEGSTIGVLGTGVDMVYPKSNASLAGQIAARGLLVSEFPLGTPALPHHFPRRNRIISGLALGCLVVEAASASGSLITARLALDQGREVFAIPGSIHSPVSRGCHELIKSGAKLVESAQDVLDELPGERRAADPAGSDAPLPEEPLLHEMGFEPVDIDSLCTRARRSAHEVSAELLRLELDGRVAALPGGLYQRLS